MQLDGGFGRVVVDRKRERERVGGRRREGEKERAKGVQHQHPREVSATRVHTNFSAMGMSGRDGRFRAVENGVGEDVDM